VQLGVLDGPGEDLLRRRRVPDVVDLDVKVREAAEVQIGPVAVLFDFDVRRLPRAVVRRYAGEDVEFFAAPLLLIEGNHGDTRILSASGGRNDADDECGDNETAHATSCGDRKGEKTQGIAASRLKLNMGVATAGRQ
jgi:hypothetical protein